MTIHDISPIHPIAHNLRKTRLQRGMSLSALARGAGISKSTLSDLERGRGNPSIDTLWVLARALNVPFAALFADDGAERPQVLRFDDAPVVTAERGRAFTARHLFTRHGRGEIEFYVLDLEPGVTRRAHGHTPGIVEHVIVISGRMEVGPDGQSEVLDAGDYIRFPADRPHHYAAIDGPTRAVALHDYV